MLKARMGRPALVLAVIALLVSGCSRSLLVEIKPLFEDQDRCWYEISFVWLDYEGNVFLDKQPGTWKELLDAQRFLALYEGLLSGRPFSSNEELRDRARQVWRMVEDRQQEDYYFEPRTTDEPGTKWALSKAVELLRGGVETEPDVFVTEVGIRKQGGLYRLQRPSWARLGMVIVFDHTLFPGQLGASLERLEGYRVNDNRTWKHMVVLPVWPNAYVGSRYFGSGKDMPVSGSGIRVILEKQSWYLQSRDY
jgi:hypothetical protein